MQLRVELLYLLDANVLIDANRDYYPIRRVPEFWAWLVYMGEQDIVKVPREVYDKVTDAKDDDLADWLKDNKEAMLFLEDIDPELVGHVIECGYAEDLTDDEIEKLNEDPFLIAYALADSEVRCVVTTERSRPNRQRANRHIPDVCHNFNIRCIDTFALVRELDFSTDWNIRNTK